MGRTLQRGAKIGTVSAEATASYCASCLCSTVDHLYVARLRTEVQADGRRKQIFVTSCLTSHLHHLSPNNTFVAYGVFQRVVVDTTSRSTSPRVSELSKALAEVIHCCSSQLPTAIFTILIQESSVCVGNIAPLASEMKLSRPLQHVGNEEESKPWE